MNVHSDSYLRSAVASFKKSSGPQMDTLLPHRAEILELRAKGATFAKIGRLLENIGINVSSDTLRRFCIREHSIDANQTVISTSLTPLRPHAAARMVDPPTPPIKNVGSRGPRIADPRNQ